MEPLGYKQAPDSIDWPSLPQFPLVGYEGAKTRSPAELRQSMIRRGEPFIKLWVSLPYNKINNTANASVAGNAHRHAASHFHRVNVSLPLER